MGGTGKHPKPVCFPQLANSHLGSPGGAQHRQPTPTAAFFSEHLVKSSAAEPARLLGSSYVCVWEESSLALGPGLVTLALLVACGSASAQGASQDLGPQPPQPSEDK